MADIKTDCNRVVNIKYLKDLIGSDIQKSDGTTYTIASTYDEKYCPKYSELTGGTYVPVAANGTTPNSDTDGLVIASQYTNNSGTKSNYDANQLVHLEDVSARYTRYKSFTASISNATNISACEGGTATISCTHKYDRTTKSMGSDCTTGSSSSEASTTSKTDGVSITTGATWISINSSKNATVPKNASASDTNPSAATRSSTVTAAVSFRGTQKASSALTVSQAARTGSYSVHDSYSWTSMNTTASTTSIGCDGGDCGINKSYSLSGTEQKHWKDICGTEFTATTTSVNASTAKTASTPAIYKSCSVTASAEEVDSGGGSITFTYTSGDSTAQTSYGVPAHFGACGGNCNVSLSLTMTDSDTSLTSTKTITQTCSNPDMIWSDRIADINRIGEPEGWGDVPSHMYANGARIQEHYTGWYAQYSQGTMTYEIVYDSPTDENWIQGFYELTDTNSHDGDNGNFGRRYSMMMELLHLGDFVNRALSMVFHETISGWYSYRSYIHVFDIWGLPNNTGAKRYAHINLYMNGVYCWRLLVDQKSL